MKTIPTEFYGDNTRWFVGRVIDSTPPAGLEGRIKVRVFGIHSPDTNDIPQRDLPWAQVMNPSTSYGVSGLGTGTQILPGALVFGLFLDGTNSQLPMILGSLPHTEYPSSVQAASRQDISTNPFAYIFAQSNSPVQDPVLTNGEEGYTAPEDNITSLSSVDCVGFFIDNGLNAKQACSLVGVLYNISNLEPLNPGGIAGYPLTSGRYSRFITYVQRVSPNKDFNSIDVQLMYVMTELQTNKKTAYSKLLMSKQIEGSLYGTNIDGIDKKGNGMVASLSKYFVHLETEYSEAGALSSAKELYANLGAR